MTRPRDPAGPWNLHRGPLSRGSLRIPLPRRQRPLFGRCQHRRSREPARRRRRRDLRGRSGAPRGLLRFAGPRLPHSQPRHRSDSPLHPDRRARGDHPLFLRSLPWPRQPLRGRGPHRHRRSLRPGGRQHASRRPRRRPARQRHSPGLRIALDPGRTGLSDDPRAFNLFAYDPAGGNGRISVTTVLEVPARSRSRPGEASPSTRAKSRKTAPFAPPSAQSTSDGMAPARLR